MALSTIQQRLKLVVIHTTKASSSAALAFHAAAHNPPDIAAELQEVQHQLDEAQHHLKEAAEATAHLTKQPSVPGASDAHAKPDAFLIPEDSWQDPRPPMPRTPPLHPGPKKA